VSFDPSVYLTPNVTNVFRAMSVVRESGPRSRMGRQNSKTERISPIPMFLCWCSFRLWNDFVTFAAAAVLGDGTEELPFAEVPALVEVASTFDARELRLLLHERLVEPVLEHLVPVEQVVGAGDVLGVVGALAAAADRVEDLQLP